LVVQHASTRRRGSAAGSAFRAVARYLAVILAGQVYLVMLVTLFDLPYQPWRLLEGWQRVRGGPMR